MPAEDEAVSFALHLGGTCLTGMARIIDVLLQAVIGYRDPYRGMYYGQGPWADRAKDKADRPKSGIVQNKDIPGDVSFVAVDDMFDQDDRGELTAEGKRQLRAFKKALSSNGVAVSVQRGVPGDGKIKFGFQAKSIDLLYDALQRARLDIRAMEPGGMAEGSPAAPDPNAPAGLIPRTEGGGYPDEFSYAGFSFSRDRDAEEGGATWVATDPDDPRRRIRCSLVGEDGADGAVWEISRNGKALSSGKVAPIADPNDDPRVSFYKYRQATEPDENGRMVPIYKEDAEGRPVLDADGNRVAYMRKVPCGPNDPDLAGREVVAGVDFNIAPAGQSLETAINCIAVRSDQIDVPAERRAASERAVAESSAAAKAVAGKGHGGGRQDPRAAEGPDLPGHIASSVEAAKRTAPAAPAPDPRKMAQAPGAPGGGRAR